MVNFFIVLISMISSVNAFSQNTIFGIPKFHGTGCKVGSTNVILSAESIDVSFLNYSLSVGGDAGVFTDGIDCTIDIPLKIPDGDSLVVENLEYSGNGRLPTGGRFVVSADLYFDVFNKISSRKVFDGPYNEIFKISKIGIEDSILDSKCVKEPTLRIRSHIILLTNQLDEDAYVSLQSAKGKVKITYMPNSCRNSKG